MASVAIIGADGAGKSTVCQAVIDRAAIPMKYVYMGVNLDASRKMLPTTRFVLWLKQRRGLRPDATFRSSTDTSRTTRGLGPNIKALLRLSYWISEEWYRQIVVWIYEIRGYVVVFDRHFFADYFAYDVAPPEGVGRTIASRLHGFMLRWLYPKPSLFILLSAPPEVLFERKQEATVEYLRERQEQYLRMAASVPAFEVVDATRPLDSVVADVEAMVCSLAPQRAAAK